jgi:sporulation protein YlmC with PRC-barrel domain
MSDPLTTTESTHKLIAASRVAGTAVQNSAGERLGTLEDVLIDKQSGRVVYALLSFGGFLGIGDKHHPLPWQSLEYDPTSGRYTVNLARERLEGAPVIDEGSYAPLEDVAWGKRVHDYYDVAPYWSILP